VRQLHVHAAERAEQPERRGLRQQLQQLVQQQPGYLGMNSVRAADGSGITVSYWSSIEAAAAWKQQAEHLQVQQLGRELWYEQYELRVCLVVREEFFPARHGGAE